MINLIRGADPWVNGRSATLHVAASNASTLSKTNTDYLCDGVADNVEIQAAINALPTNGGKIVLSEGIFSLSAAIVINKRLLLQGNGRYSTTLFLANGSNTNMIQGTGAALSEIIFRDFAMNGNKANNLVSGRCIDGTGFQHFTVTSVDIFSARQQGMYASGAAPQATNWRLYDVHIAACEGDDFYWANGSGLWLTACYFLTSVANALSLASCNDIFLIESSFDQSAGHQVSMANCGNVWVIGCYFGAGSVAGFNGLYLNIINNLTLIGNRAYQNAGNGFYFSGAINDGVIIGNESYNNTQWGWRFPGMVATNVTIAHNGARLNGSGNWSTAELGTGAVYRDNGVCVGPGEVRVVSGALTAGIANDFAFTWQNPHSSKVLNKRVMIYLATAGGTATSVLDVGPAADAISASDTLIDGLNLNTTGVFDNLNDAGTNGKSRQIVDENGGVNDWITGKILVANASTLVGRYELEYMAV